MEDHLPSPLIHSYQSRTWGWAGEGSGCYFVESQVFLGVPGTALGELDCPIKDEKSLVSGLLSMCVCGA